MELTYVWKINREAHDISDGFIHTLHWCCTGTNEKGDSTNIFSETKLKKPVSLVDYETFNTQSSLLEALKLHLGELEVRNVEKALKDRLLSLDETPTVAISIPPS